MNSALQQFAEAVQKPEEQIELDVAALLLGAIANDGALNVPECRQALDGFAESARRSLDPRDRSPRQIARVLSQSLFESARFRGNSEDYYDPRNSFLHQVIERKLGIPISLSVLYIEVARRLDLRARGVGFPGHFLVSVEDPSGPVTLDPFNRGVELDAKGLEALLARRDGEGAVVEPAMLAPIGKVAVLTRMLFNLSGIYGQRNDWTRSLAVLERLALLDPSNQRIARELVDLRARVRTLN